jgi:hypothetical protein
MGLSLMNMLCFSSNVHFAQITCYWKFLLLHYTEVLYQYRLYRLNSVEVRVKVILRPTVSRPVCLGIKHSSEAYDQIFISVILLRVSWSGASSRQRGRVCRLPESQSAVISLLSVCSICVLYVIKCMDIQHIQGLCQSWLSIADHALSLVALATTAV